MPMTYPMSMGGINASNRQNAAGASPGGLAMNLSGCIFASTADAVTAGTTPSTWLGAGVGSKSIPANFFVPGKVLRFKGFGTVTTAATPGTESISVSLGGTNVFASPSLTLPVSSTFQLRFDITVICRTAGASGTFIGFGNIDYAAGGGASETSLFGNTVAVSGAINTTGTLTVDLNSTNSVASGTVFTINASTIEVLN